MLTNEHLRKVCDVYLIVTRSLSLSEDDLAMCILQLQGYASKLLIYFDMLVVL